jgi:hypothetical protein
MRIQTIPTTVGGGATVLEWGAGSLGSSSTTRYLYPGYSDQIAEVRETRIRLPRAGSLQRLRVVHNIPAGNGNVISYIVRIGGADTPLRVDLTSTTLTGEDITNVVPVADGAYISVKANKTTGIGASPRNVTITVEFV